MRLVHTGVSDDGDLLARALQPERGGAYLCISAHGAGEAALTLAGLGADLVLTTDLEASTDLERLLELKLAAARLFGREDYLAVMGLRSASRLRRGALAHQLIRALPDEAQRWWRARRSWLVGGLFYADRQTLFFDAWLLICRRIMPKAAYQTMLFDGCAERRRAAFVQHLRGPRLKKTLGLLGARVNLFFPEAEWTASEYPRALNRDPLGYLETLVATGLSDNPLFAHLVRPRRGPLPEPLQPPHLRAQHYAQLRDADQRIKTGSSPQACLDNAPDSLRGVYLSNCIDYLEAEPRQTLLKNVYGRLEPGAPVLIYSNEAYDKVPPDCGLRLDAQASEDLGTHDRAGIYRRVQLLRRPGVPRSSRPPAPQLRVVD